MEFKGKQGIELEGYVRDRNTMLKGEDGLVHEVALDNFKQKVFNAYYWDDHKPEFPSLPYRSLGKLDEHISDVILRSCAVCDKQDWIYELIGSEPYLSSFASGHIHTSMSEIPTKQEEKELRRKLFSVQPFIELLGMNSGIYDGVQREVLDARMAYSTWSEYTTYPDVEKTSHYMSLATGDHLTLECRIPSSASKEQILGVASFIRTIIALENVPVLPIQYVEDTFYKVIKYGGQALIPLTLPDRISFLSLEGKTVYVNISDLFKKFLNDSQTKETLDEVLSEFSQKTRTKVRQFYDIISKGFTVSNLISKAFTELPRNRMIELLGTAVKESYANKKGIWEYTGIPDTHQLPFLETKIDLEELEELLKKKNDFQFEYAIDKDILDHLLYTHELSLRKSKSTRNILRKLIAEQDQKKFNNICRNMPSSLRRLFEDHDIVKNKNYQFKRGELFAYLAQLAERDGLLF